MAAGGMERLSPIIRNSSVRRLSLELCQKLGSQLLSPNLISSQGRKPSVPTPTKDFLLKCSINSSPGQVNENTGYIPRRRCSDSYSHYYTNVNENSPQACNASRRKSLTPLNCQNLPHGFQSPILGVVKLAISPIPPSPTPQSLADGYASIPTTVNKHNGSPEDRGSQVVCHVIPPTPTTVNKHNGSPEDRGSQVVCHVIPPTLIGKSQAGSDKVSSSEDEGKVFISPKSDAPRTRRRTSVSRLTQGPSRRKSSTTRYDFDDEFLKFVLLRCKLHLTPENILGRGSFGTVVAGTYRGKPVAVKVIKTKSEKKLESMKGEENALSLPPHPHITQHIDIIRLQAEKSLVILERLQKGNLLALINDAEVTFDIQRVIKISSEITSALDFCHSHGILHLDVKPQNVLLDLYGSSKLSDFGNSKRISELKNCKDFTKLDGTVAYKAPELFRGACPTTKSDVFSVGISMWQMLTREMPYMADTEHSVIYKVVAQKLRPKAVCTFQNSFIRQEQNAKIRKDFIGLYETAWEGDPDHRPSMITIYDKLCQLLKQFKH